MKILCLCVCALLLVACVKDGASDEPARDELPAGGTLLVRGEFQNGPYGSVRGVGKVIRNTNGGWDVVLDSFNTNNGPDLYVYLSREIMPVNFIQVDKLRSTGGRQVYPLLSAPDLSQYRYLLIHCKAYNHLFGYAALQ